MIRFRPINAGAPGMAGDACFPGNHRTSMGLPISAKHPPRHAHDTSDYHALLDKVVPWRGSRVGSRSEKNQQTQRV